MSLALHVPVMRQRVLDLLDVSAGDVVVDCTAGAGGHLAGLADAVGSTGRVYGFDRDPRAHRDDAAGGVAARFSQVELIQAPFSSLTKELNARGVEKVDAILADLGVSSMQLDERERGFSFQADGPLDMRMGPDAQETCAELLVRLSEKDLADTIFQLGDERRSRRIAREIKKALPLTTTTALADVVARALGGRRGRIHPATRTFQALRIAVNGELDELDALLDAIPDLLEEGGRAALISFHSLEDRRVKVRFKDEAARGAWALLTKRPLMATDDEVRENPRARSAKLRVAEREVRL